MAQGRAARRRPTVASRAADSGMLFRWLGIGFLVLSILMMSDALTPILYGDPASFANGVASSDANPARIVLMVALFGWGTLLLLYRPYLGLKLLGPAWIVLVIALLPFLSTAWSIDKATTIKRAAAHFLTISFCFYVACTWSPERYLRTLLLAVTIGCGLSDVLAVAVPTIGLNHDPESGNIGAWLGLYGDKIMSGGVSAAGVLLALIIPARTRAERTLQAGALLCCAVLCIGSQSRTGWVMVFLGLIIMGAVKLLRMRGITSGLKLGSAAGALVVAVGGLAALAPVLLPLIGRTTSLSGRTNLWLAGIQLAQTRKPFLGSGYRAFWTLEDTPSLRGYLQYIEKIPYNGHNGYIDLWLELGWLGVAVFLLSVVVIVGGVVLCAVRRPKDWVWGAMLVMIASFLVNNAAFTLAYKPANIFWATFLLSGLYVAREAVTRREAARRAPRPPLRRPSAPLATPVAAAEPLHV